MKVTVDIQETASELAHQRLEVLFNYNSEMIFVNPTDGITHFTEKAQHLFNQFYDEFYDLLWNLKE